MVDVDADGYISAGRAIDGASAVSETDTSSQPSSPPAPDRCVDGSGSSRPSLQTLAAAKTIMAASSLQQRLQERRRRASDGDGDGRDDAQRQQQRQLKEQRFVRQHQQQQQQQRRQGQPRKRLEEGEDENSSVDDSFWATTTNQPCSVTDSSHDFDSAAGKVFPSLTSLADPVADPAEASDHTESTATREIRTLRAKEPGEISGAGEGKISDRATDTLAPTVVKGHTRGNTEPVSILKGGSGGGGSGVMAHQEGESVARRRSSEISTRFVDQPHNDWALRRFRLRWNLWTVMNRR